MPFSAYLSLFFCDDDVLVITPRLLCTTTDMQIDFCCAMMMIMIFCSTMRETDGPTNEESKIFSGPWRHFSFLTPPSIIACSSPTDSMFGDFPIALVCVCLYMWTCVSRLPLGQTWVRRTYRIEERGGGQLPPPAQMWFSWESIVGYARLGKQSAVDCCVQSVERFQFKWTCRFLRSSLANWIFEFFLF